MLEKRGIQDVKELTEEEKGNFDEWERILNNEKVDVDDIKNFCERQISIIEGRWRDLKVLPKRKADLIPHHTIYKLILRTIGAPKETREQLERDLVDMIKN